MSRELLPPSGGTGVPDAATLNILKEYVLVIAGAVAAGVFKSRSDARKAASDEAETARQQVVANLQALTETFKRRVDEITAERDAATTALAAERAHAMKQLTYFLDFIRRYLRRHPDECLAPEDMEALTALGIEVIQLTQSGPCSAPDAGAHHD